MKQIMPPNYVKNRKTGSAVNNLLWKNERGMSLVEALVVLLILGAVLVPLMNTFIFGSLTAAKARHEVKALNLAQSKLEEIKNLPSNSVTDIIIPLAFAEDPEYTYKLNVVNTNYNLKTVTVSVYYQDGGTAKELAVTAEKLKR